MSRAKQFILFTLMILVPAAALTWKILASSDIRCEVCMNFNGQSKCREAQGPDQAACQQTATDNACAFLASGMTQSIQCTSTQPTSVKFK
jgi:hypothetical protein